MSTLNIQWKGRPHHHLPRVPIASSASTYGTPNLAAKDALNLPFGKKLERARVEQRMKARKRWREGCQEPSTGWVGIKMRPELSQAENSAANTPMDMLRPMNHSEELAGPYLAVRMPRSGADSSMSSKSRSSLGEQELRKDSRTALIPRMPTTDDRYSLMHTPEVRVHAIYVKRLKWLTPRRILIKLPSIHRLSVHILSLLLRTSLVPGLLGGDLHIILLRQVERKHMIPDSPSRISSVRPNLERVIHLRQFTALRIYRKRCQGSLKDLT